MKYLVKIPFMGANDQICHVIEWAVEDGSAITKGQLICSIETTKAVIEIDADDDGLLYPTCHVGERAEVGQAIGLISDSALDDPGAHVEALVSAESLGHGGGSDQIRITKKAEILLKKNGLNPLA